MYSDESLALYAVPLIHREPGASRPNLLALFEPVPRRPDALTANQLTRIRRKAVISIFGRPDENGHLLPILKRKRKANGHEMEYVAISTTKMKAVVVACTRGEHARIRRDVLAEARST